MRVSSFTGFGTAGERSADKKRDKQNDKKRDKPAEQDSDLARVIDAWPTLPQPVKAGILAMVKGKLAS